MTPGPIVVATTTVGEIPDEARDELERVAAKLGCTSGNWKMEVMFQNGSYQRAYLIHGPIGRVELEAIVGDETTRRSGAAGE